MRESFSASEPALPSAITPIAVAPAIGLFLVQSPKREAKHKSHIVSARAVGFALNGKQPLLYTAFKNSA